jgi:hypothetical protein
MRDDNDNDDDDKNKFSTKEKRKKQMRDDEHEDGPPAKHKGKWDDNYYEDNDDDGDEAYQDQFDVSAQSIVQQETCSPMSVKIMLTCRQLQAWAQAIRVDGSVIVLTSGNQELLCVIEPLTHKCVNPGYGKLQVGIYIAAIQDTMVRWWQQSLPTWQANASSS